MSEPRGEKQSKKKKRKERKRREEEEEQEEEEEERGESKENSERVILRGIFKVGKKSHDVLLSQTRLTWTPIVPETPTGEAAPRRPGVLRLQDVFSVKVKRRRAAGQVGGAVLGVALFWCRRRGRRLEEETLHLHNASVETTHTWYEQVKELIAGFPSRPRALKVFINPSSHKKEAVHVYREHVAPLFKMADIRTDITVTERKGHALSVIKECKLDQFDGVVCVGGDGSVAELCHALVLRAQLDADQPEKPVRPAIPVGIIPAGSTDVVSCSVHGVRDPVTAALHIVLGHLQQVDMCSFWCLGELLRFGFSAMFGFGGRSLARAEKKRWMPSTQRREYALVKTLAKLRPEECQLSFLPAKKSNHSLFGCRGHDQDQDQDQDQSRDQDQDQEPEGEESWRTNQGQYLSISIMSIPCLSPHAPRGLAPNTSVANGSASLIAVQNASRSEFVKHLKRFNSSGGEFSFSFVEIQPVAAVRLRPRSVIGCEDDSEDEGEAKTSPIMHRGEGDPKTSPIMHRGRAAFPWNIDGELLEVAGEVLVRVHPRLIFLYGEEVDEAESSVSCSCF
ncbi:ceramide kinase-like protein [Cololabis saira]|uniref:ceramide kinase-like protein n=1 Tax=Cololabis saira TaxID=129043 RepID=UPI002AD21500|nr:ceramide kinase-like protein [Cololabis saira]